ncbi:MAG: TonB-dependent receptor [Bacteroidales bacterium]|nr:TonB-dependent receptor [Bacteroidales bacterium]
MHHFHRLLIPLLFCLPLTLLAQTPDTTQLEGVEVIASPNAATVEAIAPTQSIDAKTISTLPTIQVSDVLKLFSGIVIRDYGGVGGMKTVQVRGFGSQHTAVSYDGIVVSDCQTGQIDLSRFSLRNAGSVALVTGADDGIFVPARAAASASTIIINTERVPYPEKKPVFVDLHFTGGSFGFVNPSLILKNYFTPRKNLWSKPSLSSVLSINYLQSKGDYPFTIHYGNAGDSTSTERRTNSDIKVLTLEENLFAHFGFQTELTAKIYYYQSERGLPGAIVFYNTKSRQRLRDQNAFGQIHFQHRFNNQWRYQVNAKFNFALQRYYDPDYLNADGFLRNVYVQREYYLSNAVLYQPHRIVVLSLANDLIFGNMNANLHDFVTPQRLQVLTTIATMVTTKRVTAHARLLHTGVANWAKNGTAGNNLSRFTPSAGISVKPILSEELYLRAFYKNIFRLPTFNDLYYNEVGNRDLRPENTHQIDVGITYEKSNRRISRSCEISEQPVQPHSLISVSATLDSYYNRVKDKIVAIPSKNLFVWSMLNFGKVEMYGLDATANVRYTLSNGKWGFHLSGNYSLQQAVDKTDKESKTYGHQIPYTPLHSGSISLGMSIFQYVEVGYTMVAAGKRYALQQNTAANELEPYTDHSLSVTGKYTISMGKKQDSMEVGVKAELLNLADKHYEVIRNYPMQGRSFRLTAWWKF